MRVKTKYLLTSVLFVILCLVALIAVVTSQDTPTASASTSSSAVCVIKGRKENIDGTPTSTGSTDSDVSEYFILTMESYTASGTGTIENFSTIDWTYARFKVQSVNVLEHTYFSLERDSVKIVDKELSGNESMTLCSISLSDGDYVMTYQMNYGRKLNYRGMLYRFRFTVDHTAPQVKLESNGGNIANGSNTANNITFSAEDPHFQRLYYKSPTASSYSSTAARSYTVEAKASNSGWWYFYATDTVGNSTIKYNVYLDCVPPTMTLANGMSFGTTVGKAITVTATDEVSTSKLYVKFESEEWFSSGNTYTIPDTERNGRYYFYAEDGNGNRTETSWIVLSTEEPSGSLIKSDTDNSVKFVWDNEYWSATLDGKSYTEGRLISNEGEHEIVLSNNATKTKKYMFKIDHCYKVASQTAATCIKNGTVKYECSQCGDKYSETVYTSGHKYEVTSTPSSCTESEHINYTCSLCGAKYETEGNYPSGHNYVSEITVEPTCTTKGARKVTCSKCGDTYTVTLAENGHDYTITDVTSTKGKTTRIYTCKDCKHSYKQELGDQYEEISNYVEYLFEQYIPYMWWVLLASAGVWSIVIGVMIAISNKNEDKEKARKMLVNYVIGLVVIAVILVACPYLIRGIAALVT